MFAALGNTPSKAQVPLGGGWAAVVGLLARTPNIDGPSHGGVNDFLAEEVLRGLEDEVREVLQVLAAMPELTLEQLVQIAGPELARRVVDQGVARGILTETVVGEYEIHYVLRKFFAGIMADQATPEVHLLVERAGNVLSGVGAWDHVFELAADSPRTG